MRRNIFEIVRRENDRFAWRLVRDEDDGKELLAESSRDYRSPKRVRRAIAKLRHAQVVEAIDSGEPGPCRLPAVEFDVVGGVTPLTLEEFPRRRRRRRRRSEASAEQRIASDLGADAAATAQIAGELKADAPAEAPEADAEEKAEKAAAFEAEAKPKAKAKAGPRPGRASGRR